MDSYSAFSTCQLDWRPSRLLAGTLLGLGILAAACLLMSRLPSSLAWPSALLALAEGARLARRESGRPGARLSWRSGEPLIWSMDDGATARLEDCRVGFRGPLAWLSGRDHSRRRIRFLWFPDTLAPSARRALRLAAASPSHPLSLPAA